ncbi:MAG: hypothetical protein R2774_09055 [Saprospiraceae bacterium]
MSPSSTTSYTVTVTSDKGCVSTTSVTVIVNPLPSGSISGDTEICVGESTTLTASGGSSYTWSTGDSGAIIKVSQSSTTSYIVTVTNDKGCVSTTSVTVIVNPLPNGSISGDTEICVGASTTLTASGGSSYAWSTGQTGSSITVSPSSTTSYTVTVTSDKGCESTTSVTVIVNPLPNGSISGDTEICVGEGTTLTASGGSSYAWSTGDSGAIITVSPSSTTSYTVTVTGDKGCVSTTSVTVIVNPLPNGSISGDTEICVGESTTLTASGGSSYAWSTGQTGGSITVSPSSTTSYTVTVTSDKGCESTTSVTVIVNPLPNGSISGDTEICIGESTTLTASGGSSYAWSTGDSGSSITVSPSSTTSYTVTVTSDKGCESTTSVTVIVLDIAKW